MCLYKKRVVGGVRERSGGAGVASNSPQPHPEAPLKAMNADVNEGGNEQPLVPASVPPTRR